MKKLLLIGFLTASILGNLFAKKLPEDLLDVNVTFVVQAQKGNVVEGFDMKEIADFCIDNGLNLVACNDLTRPLDAEKASYDYFEKKIKYVVKLDLINSMMILSVYEPTFKPGEYKKLLDKNDNMHYFVYTTVTENCMDRFSDEIKDLKKKYLGINKISYDTSLINQCFVPEELKQSIAKREDTQTLKYSLNKKTINSLPIDLKTENVAFVRVYDTEFMSMDEAYLNMKVISNLKDYPYGYKVFEKYDEYNSDSEKSKFKYRLLLAYSIKEFNSYNYHDPDPTDKSSRGESRRGWSMTSVPKGQVSIVLNDIQNNEYYNVSIPGFAGDAMRDFLKKLK